jgi:hypothetical protein
VNTEKNKQKDVHMFHIVFHTPKKHGPGTVSYYRRRSAIDRSSTYNQLELDVIRKAIKTRWEVHGFGTQRYQQSIWDLETRAGKSSPPGHLHHYMNGHIITVETAPDVMWFRLNHENVSKNRCKMIEIYRDLDFDWIDKEKEKFNKLHAIVTGRQQMISQLTNAEYNIKKTIDSATGSGIQLDDMFLEINGQFDKCVQKYKKELAREKDRMDKQSKKIFDYLESKRTVI